MPSPPSSRKPYLVYTSAGRNANVESWLEGERNFDLWITCFEDPPEGLVSIADYSTRRAGSKFQNFAALLATCRDRLQEYEYVFLLDDDILISGSEISRLFELARAFDLWLLQPAFRAVGKISHEITRRRVGWRLRYCNFVEVAVPLFRTDLLLEFMDLYDPVLSGWGIDLWYSDMILAKGVPQKVAVVDEIPCINPHDRFKRTGSRDIDRLASSRQRRLDWRTLKQARGIAFDFDRIRSDGGVRQPFLASLGAGAQELGDLTLRALRKLDRLRRRAGAGPREPRLNRR